MSKVVEAKQGMKKLNESMTAALNEFLQKQDFKKGFVHLKEIPAVAVHLKEAFELGKKLGKD